MVGAIYSRHVQHNESVSGNPGGSVCHNPSRETENTISHYKIFVLAFGTCDQAMYLTGAVPRNVASLKRDMIEGLVEDRAFQEAYD